MSEMTRAAAPLSRNVKALGVVSLLADVSSEMIFPLLPLFLTGVLGASAAMLGVIEGLAESVASMLKLASGWWSDRVRSRKPLVVAGYGISALIRPLIGLATAPWHILAARVADRVGKGILRSGWRRRVKEANDLLRVGADGKHWDANWSMIKAGANAWRDGAISGIAGGTLGAGGACECKQ